MPYSDLARVTLAAGGADRLVQIADWDGMNGSGDPVKIAEVVATAIASVDAVIDSYLGGRYQVPIAAPSVLLQDISAAMAVYWMLEKRSTPTEHQIAAQAAREKMLMQMAAGIVKPNNPTPATNASPRVIESGSELARKFWS